MKLNGETFEPRCLLAHDMINRFAVIVGYCDLLLEESLVDAKVSKRLLLMREIAKSAAGELIQRDCTFGDSAQKLVTPKESQQRPV